MVNVSSTEKSISITLTVPEKWRRSADGESVSLLQVYPGLQYNVSVLKKKTKKRVSSENAIELCLLSLCTVLCNSKIWNRAHNMTGTVGSLSIFLCQVDQNWMHYSRCGLMSTEWRGIIPYQHLLDPLLLTQPRMLLTSFAARARCWFMFSLLPILAVFSRVAPQPVRLTPQHNKVHPLPPHLKVFIHLSPDLNSIKE